MQGDQNIKERIISNNNSNIENNESFNKENNKENKQRNRRKKKVMYIMIGVLLVILGGILIWFHIPYSPVKKAFEREVSSLRKENRLHIESGVFREEEFEYLPAAIQNYVKSCGYIGTPKMSFLKMEYHNVNFMQGRKGPALKIDYTQYNIIKEPSRMALIDSSMFGIPFEGYDYYKGGKGGMKGVIAKVITLFNQQGTDMDKACLVTFLAESLFAPSILLEKYIKFEELSPYEIKATISYYDTIASGIFTFNEQYEMISFTTHDRGVAGTDGTIEYVPWSALCSDYEMTDSKIKYPTKFQAVWNYPDEDFIYFDGLISQVTYDLPLRSE